MILNTSMSGKDQKQLWLRRSTSLCMLALMESWLISQSQRESRTSQEFSINISRMSTIMVPSSFLESASQQSLKRLKRFTKSIVSLSNFAATTLEFRLFSALRMLTCHLGKPTLRDGLARRSLEYNYMWTFSLTTQRISQSLLWLTSSLWSSWWNKM